MEKIDISRLSLFVAVAETSNFSAPPIGPRG
jgi:hypothetical protein